MRIPETENIIVRTNGILMKNADQIIFAPGTQMNRGLDQTLRENLSDLVLKLNEILFSQHRKINGGWPETS